MIPLSDTIWKALGTAYGDATAVAEALKEAQDAASRDPGAIEEIFTTIWSHVCHQGTPYPALFATVPHLIEIAEMLDPGTRERAHILGALGYAAVNAGMSVHSVGRIGDLDPERFDFRPALRRAATLVAETLLHDHEETITAHLFAALAAIKGDADLYFAMWGLFDNIERHDRSDPE